MRAEAAAAFRCALAASEALESLARAHNNELDNFARARAHATITCAHATICTRTAFNETVPACLAWTAIRAHLGATA